MAKSPKEKFALAKQKLSFQWRFLNPLMFSLKWIEQEGMGTAGTDGVSVWWDPEYIGNLPNISQVMFVIVHEELHPARKHHLRAMNMKDLNKRVANIAMDAVINYMIIHEMGLEAPEGAVDMPQYKGWAWEAVYRDLMKKEDETPQWDEVYPYPGWGEDGDEKEGNGKGKPEPGPGEKENADSVEVRMEEKRIEGQLKEMERIGKKAGKMPGSFKSLVKDMTMTKVPWEQVLARFVDDVSDKDYNWMVPDENYINGDIYIPTLHEPKIGKGAIFFDTSESVSDDDFKKFKGGLYGILSAYDIEVFIAEIDYVVQKSYTISSTELSTLVVEFAGKGGTNFDAGFELIKKDDLQPKFIIYFTDGECGVSPESEPDCPVLWALLKRSYSENFKPPFGEVLFID